MFRFIFCAVALSGFAVSHEESGECEKGTEPYRVTLRHIESGGIGYEVGYTTLETFFASDPNRWKVTPFFDARGHVFDNGKWAANVGAGLRTILKNRVYGINTYYDYRNTGRLNANQIGLGLETLGELFDFRLNGYLPIGKKISSPYASRFGTFSGHHMLVSQKYHSAMKGADAEFGFHLKKSKSFEFYAAAGPYYFIGEKAPTTWGGKGRISGSFKDLLTLEVSDSYDNTFHNKFQGQISLSFSFGPQSKVKERELSCKTKHLLNDRTVQPVGRQEIIVVDKLRKNSIAINPATGLPYFFVFVDNTSSSDGTYESPYHTFAQAQNNSSSNDIIYVFPGDGTTTGMDSGIGLKANQKLWGSGVTHPIETAQGEISIPAQTSSSPIITNTNVDTEGNAITLATNNAISGFTIRSALNDGIYGTDARNLNVSSCTFQGIATYPIEAYFSGNALLSITNNQFLSNVNGIFFTLNGTSTLICSNNTFSGQSSVSNVPVEITSNSNRFTTYIQNNTFNANTTGSIRFALTNAIDVNIIVSSNTITNNGTGSQSTLGSSLVLLSTGTIDNCSIELTDNNFSNNTSNSLYLHTSGTITSLDITTSTNTMSDNGGSGLVIATPTNTLTLVATENIITGCNDNAMAIISSGSTSTGNITINNNTITDIGNQSNGIAVNQNFSTLTLTVSNNEINGCEGSGILSYAPTGINNLTLNISENTISNCENLSSNAAGGIDIEQYTTLAGSITNNTLLNNTATGLAIGSTLTTPAVCLTLTGNNNNNTYLLSNPGDGVFNLSPCDVNTTNIGTINTSGTITAVQSCPAGTPCPP